MRLKKWLEKARHNLAKVPIVIAVHATNDKEAPYCDIAEIMAQVSAAARETRAEHSYKALRDVPEDCANSDPQRKHKRKDYGHHYYQYALVDTSVDMVWGAVLDGLCRLAPREGDPLHGIGNRSDVIDLVTDDEPEAAHDSAGPSRRVADEHRPGRRQTPSRFSPERRRKRKRRRVRVDADPQRDRKDSRPARRERPLPWQQEDSRPAPGRSRSRTRRERSRSYCRHPRERSFMPEPSSSYDMYYRRSPNGYHYDEHSPMERLSNNFMMMSHECFMMAQGARRGSMPAPPPPPMYFGRPRSPPRRRYEDSRSPSRRHQRYRRR